MKDTIDTHIFGNTSHLYFIDSLSGQYQCQADKVLIHSVVQTFTKVVHHIWILSDQFQSAHLNRSMASIAFTCQLLSGVFHPVKLSGVSQVLPNLEVNLRCSCCQKFCIQSGCQVSCKLFLIYISTQIAVVVQYFASSQIVRCLTSPF